jgi:transcriptional antiterminator RfaH
MHALAEKSRMRQGAEKSEESCTFREAHGIQLAPLRHGFLRPFRMNASPHEWFVVRSKARKEDLALRSLERRGITAFCPRILEPVGWTNDWATVPLFPGYLFVDIVLHAAYHAVVWTPGIKSFVSFGEIPTAIAPGIVNFLREQTGPDGVIRPVRTFRAGERVRIKRGPFAGLIAIIEKPCAERGRIRVLMDVLRQGTSVELPLAAVGRL